MNVGALIHDPSTARVWGLTPAERIRRFLARLGVSEVLDLDPAPTDSVLLISGDHVYDDRVVKALLDRPAAMLRSREGGRPRIVAAHVPKEAASRALTWLESDGEGQPPWPVFEPADLVDSSLLTLLKSQPPYALRVTEGNRMAIERFLYDCTYKGVTDLVTKWIWPVPARIAVGWCVRFGLRPNHVTILGFLLMLAALAAFAFGMYGWGLVAAWIMTFLDTVDGKLARTTLTSSRFGHYLDKLTDLLHPPFWYWAWALGLATDAVAPPSVESSTLVVAIFVFYVLGRVLEGCGSGLVSGGIFVWRRVDSVFRLVTARRNTCLIFLTAGGLAGRPDLGLWGVALWTVATTVFLLVRIVLAYRARRVAGGRLTSWLSELSGTRRAQVVSAAEGIP